MEYNALILLPPVINISLEEIAKMLETSFSKQGTKVDTSVENIYLTLNNGSWSCQIALNSDDYVLLESKELSEEFAAARADAEEIASCNRRLEVDFTDDDNATYFNNYINILQELGSIEKSKVFDAAVGEFIM